MFHHRAHFASPGRRVRSALAVGAILLLGLLPVARTQARGPASQAAGAPDRAGIAAARTPLTAAALPTATAAAAWPAAAGNPLGLVVADSELVYGSTLFQWDVGQFVAGQGGYLARYAEAVDGELLTGAQIVQRVAEDYSVGPRVLLALVEMHGGWVRNPSPAEQVFPLDEPQPGLYAGLSAAAGALNTAYYGFRYQNQRTLAVANGQSVPVDALNAGTYAVLAYLGRNVPPADWPGLQSASRFYMAWMALFGDPYQYQVQPTLPSELPPLQLALPWPAGETWYFVQGPHNAWGPGTPRAAVDFAPPPAEAAGCEPSASWVTAAAPGVVTRARASGVAVDRDGDGFEGSGWSLVYSHLTAADRVAAGKGVQLGDRLGHPSCEAGLATQTQLGFARKYNGEWVPADLPAAPLQLGGYTVIPSQAPGGGFLLRSGETPRPAGARKVDAANGVQAAAGGPQP